MADVKWIKIVTDIFDDEKILLIESLPEADSIIVIWFKLLCLSGKNNNRGVFIMNDRIPYTDEMLATIFRRPINTVRLALDTFDKFGMIELINDVITIPNWSKHQNLDQLEEKKNYMKDYMRKYREKQKQLANNDCKTNSKVNSKTNSKVNVSSLDIDKEEDKEEDKEIKDIYIAQSDKITHEPTPTEPSVITITLNDKSEYPIYQSMVDEWNELYPNVDVLQELRKMKGWSNANPAKRKTKKGIQRFINAWLSREQDKPSYNKKTAPVINNSTDDGFAF